MLRGSVSYVWSMRTNQNVKLSLLPRQSSIRNHLSMQCGNMHTMSVTSVRRYGYESDMVIDTALKTHIEFITTINYKQLFFQYRYDLSTSTTFTLHFLVSLILHAI